MKEKETILIEYRQGDIYTRLNLFCQYRSYRDEFKAIERREGVGEMIYPVSLTELIKGKRKAKHKKHWNWAKIPSFYYYVKVKGEIHGREKRDTYRLYHMLSQLWNQGDC